MRISIDQKILENILGYMVTQPYKEVAQLWNGYDHLFCLGFGHCKYRG